MKSFTKILALISLTIFTSKTASSAPIPPHKIRQSGGHYLQKRDGLSRRSVDPRSLMMMRHMRRLSTQSDVDPLLNALLGSTATDSPGDGANTSGSSESGLSLKAFPSTSSDIVDLSTSKRASDLTVVKNIQNTLEALEGLSSDVKPLDMRFGGLASV